MSDRWFYIFIASVASFVAVSWYIIRDMDFVSDYNLTVFYDIGAVVACLVVAILIISRIRENSDG